jgi:hypothetical protein
VQPCGCVEGLTSPAIAAVVASRDDGGMRERTAPLPRPLPGGLLARAALNARRAGHKRPRCNETLPTGGATRPTRPRSPAPANAAYKRKRSGARCARVTNTSILRSRGESPSGRGPQTQPHKRGVGDPRCDSRRRLPGLVDDRFASEARLLRPDRMRGFGRAFHTRFDPATTREESRMQGVRSRSAGGKLRAAVSRARRLRFGA